MARLKAEQRRSQLIAVATKLFARNGYDATTTAAIAEAAGVTEPILYRHFTSKQEMFTVIVRQTSRRAIDGWAEMIQGIASPTDQLRTIARGFPEHIRRLADEYHVLHGALACSRDRKVLQVLREHYTQIEQFFHGILQAGQKAGVFRAELNCRVAAWQLITMGLGYVMLDLNLSQLDRFPAPEAFEAFLHGIARSS